jgi:hypothetical protein
MKWVRFKKDFDEGGALHELLKKEGKDKLTAKPDPNAPKGSKGVNICFSGAEDSVIDNNFRIYGDESEFKAIYLNDHATYKDTFHFHRWGCVIEIPPSYDPKMLKTSAYSLLQPYELFIGGWIDFWDTEVRQDGTDHAVYFKLHEIGEDRYTVITYILQTKSPVHLNVYVNVANPPTSTDPPPTKGKPPY